MKFLKAINNFKKQNDIKMSTIGMFCGFVFLRFRYGIGINDYLTNYLFDKKRDHSDYFNNLHRYIHKWKNCSKKFAKDKSKAWKFFHYIQFLFYKVLYPGLDAMDYFRYEFYRIKHKQRKAFITEGYLKKMNRHFNPLTSKAKTYYDVLDNKLKFNAYFKSFIKRDWISSDINKEDFVSFCKKHSEVFIKPICGGGGAGIRKVFLKSDVEMVDLFDQLSGGHYILEEAIKQSTSLNAMNSTSINTIRVFSVMHNNVVHLIGATFRVGNGKGFVDNYSLGNYAANINLDDGVVDSSAVTQNGERVFVHPVTNTEFVGFRIPSIQLIKNLVTEAHKLLPELRYIGWDVALNNKEEPLLIEGNTFAGVELQQHPCLIGKKYIYRKYW